MVRAALVQFSGHQSKEINIQKAEDLARQAAGNGARIICLPELSTTIYFCFDRDKKWFETAEPIPGPAVNRLAKVAKETGTVIVYPLYENDNGTLYNTAAVLGPDGNLIGRYRKMSIPQILRTVKPGETPGDERFFFAPGNLGFPVFDTPFGVKIGILICYDRHFPEAARILGLKGAHLLLVPTATYREWIREVWEIELRGHAIANMFYVGRSEEHTSELQSRLHLVCRLLLEKKKKSASSSTTKTTRAHSRHMLNTTSLNTSL